MRRISFVLISCVSKKISAIKIKRIGKNFLQVQVHRASSIEYQLKYLFNMNQESLLIFVDNHFCFFIFALAFMIQIKSAKRILLLYDGLITLIS